MQFNQLIAIAMLFFAIPFSYAKEVTAVKLTQIPRNASIEEAIVPLLKKSETKDWKQIPLVLRENAKYENKKRGFKIESGKEDPNSGDLARYSFYVTKAKHRKEPLTSKPVSNVMVLSDGEYLLVEPLILIPTATWKRIDLAEAAHIEPYFEVVRYSPTSHRLLVAQYDCAYDCPQDDKTTIWEIGF